MRFATQLTTPRLILRAPRAQDAGKVHAAWGQDPEVFRYLASPPSDSLATTRARLAWDQARWSKRSAWTWLIATQGAPDTPIGLVQLLPQSLEGDPHHQRLGYLLARSHWGQGLMAEALAALLAMLTDEAQLWRLDALVDVDNAASARLLERLGFDCEGRLKRHSRHPLASPEPRDVWVYAWLRPARDPCTGSTSCPGPTWPRW